MTAVAAGTGEVLVRALGRPGRLPPLFCVSGPGVNALGHVALARSLGPDETVFSVQGPGARRGREYRPEEHAALGAAYVEAVRAVQPEGPYFLAGMCDGAHIAFEMARRIEAQGGRVALLAVLDTWPVENASRYPLVVLHGLVKRFLQRRGRERVAWVARGAARLVRRLFGALRGRAIAAEEHRQWKARVWPGPGFVPPRSRVRIAVLRARRQGWYRVRDDSLGWRARTTGPVEIHVVPGDHESLLRRPHVEELGRVLRQRLAAARASP